MRIGDQSLKELSDVELEEELRRRRRARGHAAHGDSVGTAGDGAVKLPLTTRRGRSRGGQRHPGWKVRQWYRNLELEPGASRDEVELAYVRLSEKYHPDRHEGGDKKRLAMQLAGGLREAYRGIVESLDESVDDD